MRNYCVLVGLLLLMAASVVAQDYATVETSPAFMFIRTPIANQSVNCAGAGGTLAYNVSKMLGIAADMGGCKFFGNTFGAGNQLSGSQFTFLFGPRITFRGNSPFQPFFDVNLGGDRLSANCQSGAVNCIAKFGSGTYSRTAFALTAGGGIDVKLSKKFALRLIQAEYLYTRFGNECGQAVCTQNNSQNSFRLKSGIVIGWGEGSK